MDGGSRPRRRNFLILQGVASRFFARLGEALETRGFGVRRINFHAGDWLFGPFRGVCNYRGGLSQWPDFLEAKLSEWEITDIILFGDCRPVHAAAIAIAKRHQIPHYVFEEGYLRPNWITLERGGTNGNSTMPNDPEWILAEAQALPPFQEGEPTSTGFWTLAGQDIAYNLSSIVLAWLFPAYRRHRHWNPILEYAGWAGRLVRQRLFDKKYIAEGLRAVQCSGNSYFFFPLQVEGDTQIHRHSPYGGIAPAIEHVVGSFARHAPPRTLLVIKEHPLDNGLNDWHGIVRQHARAAGVADRVIYLAGGNLEVLVAAAKAVVTINSTVGARALVHSKPLIALGKAIYNVPGLTFQDGLDAFWTNCMAADEALFEAFARILVQRCLVNGNFYSKEGIALAVAGSIARIEAAPHRFLEAVSAPVHREAADGSAHPVAAFN